MMLGGAAVLALSAVMVWLFSLPNWGIGVAVLGGILGVSAMASPLFPEQHGDGGADMPEAEPGGEGGAADGKDDSDGAGGGGDGGAGGGGDGGGGT